MAGVMKTAGIVGCAVRELARLHYRDDIQHRRNPDVIRFMKTPTSTIRLEIADLLRAGLPEHEDRARFILQRIAARFNMNGILDRVPEYVNALPENLIRKGIHERTSNLPAKIISVMGSDQIPDSRDSDAAYELGKILAKAGIVVVCHKTNGILVPFLRGMTENGGLTVGILSEEQARAHKNHISENSGLIKLPVVTPYENGSLRTTIAAMSGRIIIILNGEKDSSSIRATMDAAYSGTPVIFIGQKPGRIKHDFPKPIDHPLQVQVPWERAFKEIEERLFLDGEIDGVYHYFDQPRTPISVLASTKSSDSENIYRVTTEVVERVVTGLCDLNCFPITGSGPGDMQTVARSAHQKGALTLGLAFFRTFLASNPYIDIPIIGNLKMERADFMALSSVATINLGGSHATVDEIVSAIQFGKPVISCVPDFNIDYFKQLGGRTSAPIFSASSPDKTIEILRRLIA